MKRDYGDPVYKDFRKKSGSVSVSRKKGMSLHSAQICKNPTRNARRSKYKNFHWIPVHRVRSVLRRLSRYQHFIPERNYRYTILYLQNWYVYSALRTPRRGQK